MAALSHPLEAIVLSAGSSSRLGRPKALLEFGDRTALQLVLDSLREAGVASGAVVVGEHGTEIAAAVDPEPLEWAHNPFPEAGRTGSVLIGLGVCGSDHDVLLWPVDRPLASAATVRRLIEARDRVGEGAGVIVPETDGGRGHPFVLRTPLLSRILGASPDANLREVIRESGTERLEVPVADPGIHFDLDSVEDYERALAWWRERQRA